MAEDSKSLNENPLEQEAPEGVIERVHTFARDLAWGVLNDFWDADFEIISHSEGSGWFVSSSTKDKGHKIFSDYLSNKWSTNPPSDGLLVTLGFITVFEQRNGVKIHRLTTKAFDLLNKPTIAPQIFISYRRAVSSALSLAVEARLKLKIFKLVFLSINP